MCKKCFELPTLYRYNLKLELISSLIIIIIYYINYKVYYYTPIRICIDIISYIIFVYEKYRVIVHFTPIKNECKLGK